MGLKGEQEAIMFVPPVIAGTGTDNDTQQTPIVAAPGDPVDLGPNIFTVPCWFTFKPSIDCYIGFSADGGESGVATSDDWPLSAGEEFNRIVDIRHRYVSVIKASGGDPDGVLKYYCSQPTLPAS